MNVLARSVDAVVGVDTHRDSLAAAVVTPIGAVLASTQVSADARLPRAS
jgi:transposase